MQSQAYVLRYELYFNLSFDDDRLLAQKLGNLADSMFTLKLGSDLWLNAMHEPLTIAFVKSYLIALP